MDLPEYFEDHMPEWCTGFHAYLSYNPPEQIAQVVRSENLSAGLLTKVLLPNIPIVNENRYVQTFA